MAQSHRVIVLGGGFGGLYATLLSPRHGVPAQKLASRNDASSFGDNSTFCASGIGDHRLGLHPLVQIRKDFQDS